MTACSDHLDHIVQNHQKLKTTAKTVQEALTAVPVQTISLCSLCSLCSETATLSVFLQVFAWLSKSCGVLISCGFAPAGNSPSLRKCSVTCARQDAVLRERNIETAGCSQILQSDQPNTQTMMQLVLCSHLIFFNCHRMLQVSESKLTTLASKRRGTKERQREGQNP